MEPPHFVRCEARNVFGYSRVTFLVARDETIAQVWPSVDPGVNATEVLSAIATLTP